MPDLTDLAREERVELLDLLRALTPEQWSAASLCEGWSVRDVVAHMLSYEELSWPQVVGAFTRARFRPAAINDVARSRYRDHSPADLVDLLAAHLRPRGFTTLLGGGIALADGLIHQQDIRRPLGMTRAVPVERLRPVLDLAAKAPTLPSKANRKGLRLVTTDLDWSVGEGPEVTGPGEAMLMVMAGRPVAVAELGGPGLDTLRRRVNATG